MAKLEREYNVPLRQGYINKPRHKRAKKAVGTLRDFLKKHMKSDEIKIGQHLNKHIWKHGMKNPPHHVKITAVKEDDVVKAELQGFEFTETIKPSEKEAEQTGLAGKLAEKFGGKDKKEESVDDKKVEKEKTETKVEEKETKETTQTKPAVKKTSKKVIKKTAKKTSTKKTTKKTTKKSSTTKTTKKK